jgi:hypothetical protein
MAVVYMRPRVRSIDVATRFGDLAREASRRAIALGPVRADVATALGSKARTQILAAPASGTRVAFTLFRLQEGAPGVGTWLPVETYTTDANVLSAGWLGAVGPHSTDVDPDWGTFELQCLPDATCDPRTLFFEASTAGASFEQRARVSVMPIGGAITTFTDWN